MFLLELRKMISFDADMIYRIKTL